MHQPRSDTFPLWLLAAILGLFTALHAIWSILFEEWIKLKLEHAVGLTVAEMIERFGAIGVPTLLAIGIVWLLYHYIKRQFENELAEIVRPRIKFGAVKEHVEFPGSDRTLDQQHLEVRNEGKGMLQNCLVTIDKVKWDDGSQIEPRVALATVARAREGKVGRFNLDAGSPKQLLLTSRDLSDPRNPGSHNLMGESYPIPLHRGKSGTVFFAAAAS
jgi:hypothetical protein